MRSLAAKLSIWSGCLSGEATTSAQTPKTIFSSRSMSTNPGTFIRYKLQSRLPQDSDSLQFEIVDGRQMPVLLGIIQSVADKKALFNNTSHIIDDKLSVASLTLVDQGAETHTFGFL